MRICDVCRDRAWLASACIVYGKSTLKLFGPSSCSQRQTLTSSIISLMRRLMELCGHSVKRSFLLEQCKQTESCQHAMSATDQLSVMDRSMASVVTCLESCVCVCKCNVGSTSLNGYVQMLLIRSKPAVCLFYVPIAYEKSFQMIDPFRSASRPIIQIELR